MEDTQELITKIIETFVATADRWSSKLPREPRTFKECLAQNPMGMASTMLFEALTPVLVAAIAENAIVTRDELGLLKRLNEPRDPHRGMFIQLKDDGRGKIVTCHGNMRAAFGPGSDHKTAADAIESLLEPAAKPEPEECECRQCELVTLLLSGVPDPTGSTLLWKGREFVIVRKPEE